MDEPTLRILDRVLIDVNEALYKRWNTPKAVTTYLSMLKDKNVQTEREMKEQARIVSEKEFTDFVRSQLKKKHNDKEKEFDHQIDFLYALKLAMLFGMKRAGVTLGRVFGELDEEERSFLMKCCGKREFSEGLGRGVGESFSGLGSEERDWARHMAMENKNFAMYLGGSIGDSFSKQGDDELDWVRGLAMKNNNFAIGLGRHWANHSRTWARRSGIGLASWRWRMRTSPFT